MIPWAPMAWAANASGATRSRSPAACDGSTMTGRWVRCRSTGTALRSSVFRVDVSKRPDPTLTEEHLLVPLGEYVFGGLQQFVEGRAHPPLQHHRAMGPPAAESKEFCMFLVPIWRMSALRATPSTSSGDTTSVTTGSPYALPASTSISRPS